MPVVRIADRYVLLGVLGLGGTSTVHLALDERNGERVALKEVHAHMAGSEATRRRLAREVRLAGALVHPNLLLATEVVDVPEGLFLRMPLHPGNTLEEHVQTVGPMSHRDLVRLAEQVGGALAVAHGEGVVHRDVTPMNVMLDRGEAQLTDFGLARVLGEQARTMTGTLGTPGFVAPEVLAGRRATPEADVYGLAATLFFAATGQRPPMDDALAVLDARRGDLPRATRVAIAAGLHVHARARPPGVRQLVESMTSAASASPHLPTTGAGLPTGEWMVWVASGLDPSAVRRQRGAGVEATLEQVRTRVEGWLGIERGRTVQEELANAVAQAAGLPDDALSAPVTLFAPRFRLVEAVDEETARTLAGVVEGLGMTAHVQHRSESRPHRPMLLATWVSSFVVLLVLTLAFAVAQRPELAALAGGVALIPLTLLIHRVMVGHRSTGAKAPLVYPGGLARWLAPGFESYRSALTDRVGAVPSLSERARSAVEDLITALESGESLGALPRRDLLKSARALQVHVAQAIIALRGVREELARLQDVRSVEGITTRLVRMRTLAAAGHAVDDDTIRSLERQVGAAQQATARRDQLHDRENRLVAILLDAVATCGRVRGDVVDGLTTEPLREQTAQRLGEQVDAAARARREVERAGR